jgi:PKD repeat protein
MDSMMISMETVGLSLLTLTYFNNMEWITQNGLTAYFDFNRNGKIDFNDVIVLYNKIGQS